MIVKGTGNVGIGKTNPITTLDVAGSATISGSVRARSAHESGELYFGNGTAVGMFRDNSYDLSIKQGSSSSHALYLGSALDVIVAIDGNNNDTTAKFAVGYNTYKPTASYLFTVLETGFVGIGIDAPSSKLHIGGVASSAHEVAIKISVDGEFDGSIEFNDDDAPTTQYYRMSFNASLETLRFHSDTTDNVLLLQNTGNVGIGTGAPSARLHVYSATAGADGLYIEKTSDENNYALRVKHDTAASNRIIAEFQNGAGAVMTILGDGTVGINDASPTYNLDVNGTFRTTGLATFDAGLTLTGNQTVTGDLTVGGTVTAQEFHAEFVSSSIIYESGSTKFGDTLDDRHEFTGSVYTNGAN